MQLVIATDEPLIVAANRLEAVGADAPTSSGWQRLTAGGTEVTKPYLSVPGRLKHPRQDIEGFFTHWLRIKQFTVHLNLTNAP